MNFKTFFVSAAALLAVSAFAADKTPAPKSTKPDKICILVTDVGTIDTVAKTEEFLLKIKQFNVESAPQASAADKAAGGAAAYFWVIVLVSIVCFVLAFMGKKKNSLATGVAILVGGVFILINGFIGFGSMLWGTATGGLYIASGIVSILNNKRGN